MEKLNDYLQTLLSTCSYELHLEPNKQPFVISSDGTTDIAGTPLLGTQISTMIFPLIPINVRQELPNKAEVEFTHAHNLGNFSFLVRKSPSGFNVTIRPLLLTDETLAQEFFSQSAEPEANLTSPIFNQPNNQVRSSFAAVSHEEEAAPPDTFEFESVSSAHEQVRRFLDDFLNSA